MSTTTGPRTGHATERDRETALRLGDAVGRLVRMLRRAHVGDLGPASAAALMTIVRTGPLRMGDLAEFEGVTPAALSRVVSGLQRGRLVRRSPDPQDRRSTFVVATDRGRDAASLLRSARSQALVARIARLSEKDRATLLGAMDVLERLVDEPAHDD